MYCHSIARDGFLLCDERLIISNLPLIAIAAIQKLLTLSTANSLAIALFE